MAIITISRMIGSLGEEIGQSLARKLNYEYLDRQSMLQLFLEPYISPFEFRLLLESPKSFFRTFRHPETGTDITYFDFLSEVLPRYAEGHPGVWLGFGADQFLKSFPQAAHIRITASEQTRVSRLIRSQALAQEEAVRMLRIQDRIDKRFLFTLFGHDNSDTLHYDLIINTDRMSLLAASNAIEASWKDVFARHMLEISENEKGVSLNPSEVPRLKNEAEIEVARLLDMYNVEWRYEPKTFPIEWDDDGKVTMAFSPDFYLPRFNTYLELTTMDQRYVTIKNKKARKAKELYGVNIKIVYRKDFLDMISRIDRDE